LVELHGVGDFQSSGILYNRLEDWHRDALKTDVGDKLVYIGQRKLFGLGVIGGTQFKDDTLFHNHVVSGGGGLLWSVTSTDGWGLEVLFGAYVRNGTDEKFVLSGSTYYDETIQHQAVYMAPIWLKKNFFYPSTVSPFLAAGGAIMRAENGHHIFILQGSQPFLIDDRRKVNTVVPMVGAGVEFFSGRFLRPRVEVRYFNGPSVNAADNSFKTSGLFWSVGFLTTW
jgi:hypothetical protein